MVKSPAELCYVDSDMALLDVCQRASQCKVIALDTEFVRETTYFSNPALIQLYFGQQVYLIDPLAIKDFEPLKVLFCDSSVIKVMHSCLEDMEVFSHLLGVLPAPIFDTQVAAAMVGHGFSMSYQRLVELVVAHDLDKSETRSNWLQRPLTERQIQYAAEDVLWLLDIYNDLNQSLLDNDRVDWCREDCQLIIDRASEPQNDDVFYLRIKSAWRLDPLSLNVLRAVCAWRESTAREKNVPRGRIASDAALIELSQIKPINKTALANLSRLKPNVIRQFGEKILHTIDSASCMASENYPPRLLQKNSKDYKCLLKSMQKVVREAAAVMNIPVEILGRKRDLEEYLQEKESSMIFRSWRSILLAKKFDYLILNSKFVA